ncbi:hypothetical protein H0G86_005863 [Trichoderma simmonsii]|uniref:Uncharacterized protein n=1 Tax=Trichoderma simmonsii TaxID=1491479 RepID=A0A8G0LFJ0_9HYPO|nr:hypothetical protein H0G86_005863 [Trichoderma simmonsii]
MSLRLKILASVASGDNELADHLRAQILPGLDPPRRAVPGPGPSSSGGLSRHPALVDRVQDVENWESLLALLFHRRVPGNCERLRASSHGRRDLGIFFGEVEPALWKPAFVESWRGQESNCHHSS